MKIPDFVRLHALGGLSLSRSGRRLPGAGARRKPLALLALLAGAGPSGTSRDRITAFLWPEADTESARTVLRQTLYALRRDLAAPDLVLGSIELRLNPDVITVDVIELLDAADRGDLERVAALYTGPFLDGFHLPDALEFERWQDAERARLDSRVRAALQTLASAADERGDHEAAVRWWGRLTEIDGLSARVAIGFMRALAGSGDAARAVRHARAHAQLLQKELNASPDTAVTELAEDLLVPPDRKSRPAGSVVSVPAVPDALDVSKSEPTVPAGRAVTEAGLARRMWARVTVFAAAAAALAMLTWSARSASTENVNLTEAAIPPSPGLVAVLPFQVRGVADTSELGEGLMELLATDLDIGEEFRSADPTAVLAVLRRSGGHGTVSSIRAATRAVGAERYVRGEVVEIDGRVRLSAEMWRLAIDGRDSLLARASVDGARDGIFYLVDQLAARLLSGERTAGGALLDRIAEHATDSLAALKEFLAGSRALRRGQFARAASFLVRATEIDTAFALAHYRLASASEWNIQYDRARVAADRALAHSDRLGVRERLLAAALKAYLGGEGRRAEKLYEDVVSLYPEDVEAWFRLAELRFHYFAVRDRPIEDSRQAWLNVARWDPDHVGMLVHLARLAARAADTIAIDTLVQRIQRVSPVGDRLWEVRGLQAYAKGPSSPERAHARAFERELIAAGDSAVLVAWGSTWYADNQPARRRLAMVLARSSNSEMRSLALFSLADIEAMHGRPLAADSILRELATFDAAVALEHRAWFATLPIFNVPRSLLDTLARELRAWDADRTTTLARSTRTQAFATHQDVHPQLRLYLLGRVVARLGRWKEQEDAEVQLRSIGGTGQARALGADLAISLASQRAAARGDSARAAALLDSVRIEVAVELLNSSFFWSQTAEQFERAKFARWRGRPDIALGTLSAVAQTPTFNAAASFEAAEIHRAAGRMEEAVRHYRRVVILWAKAEPGQQGLTTLANRWLAALTAQ